MALVVGASAEGHPHGGFGPVGACKQVAGALGVVQQFGGRRAAVAGRQQVIASVKPLFMRWKAMLFSHHAACSRAWVWSEERRVGEKGVCQFRSVWSRTT